MAKAKKQSKKFDDLRSTVEALNRGDLGVLHESPHGFEGGLYEVDSKAMEVANDALQNPWRCWKVKPILEIMLATPAEAGIGKRIAYCRGQLDNLSVDALARYTKFFDEEGISRSSLVRYEAGTSMPGARELRILCDTLWVSPNWLLLGKLEASTSTGFGQAVENALNLHLERLGVGGVSRMIQELNASHEEEAVEKRQKWIDEARKT